MKLFLKSPLFCIFSLYMGFVLGLINNTVVCLKFKEFSKHYSFCFLYTEDESLLDLEPIDVLIKYIVLSNDILIREGLPKLKRH